MKILMVCAGGMSSAMVIRAIEQEGVKQGLEMKVKAVGIYEFEDEIKNGWDVGLVAPQVRHCLANFQKAGNEANVPVIAMSPQCYTPLGGARALAEAKAAAAK
ncbi:MAG: PTS sugar transporter subunit IIB [Negativicutes bacterium]|jgi:PTS system cellobiose-specific IIB component